MEVKIDNEAQVCRLCGQFESIYIDVFGDEGSKRLLGLKIQSKINILVSLFIYLLTIIASATKDNVFFFVLFSWLFYERQREIGVRKMADANGRLTFLLINIFLYIYMSSHGVNDAFQYEHH